MYLTCTSSKSYDHVFICLKVNNVEKKKEKEETNKKKKVNKRKISLFYIAFGGLYIFIYQKYILIMQHFLFNLLSKNYSYIYFSKTDIKEMFHYYSSQIILSATIQGSQMVPFPP